VHSLNESWRRTLKETSGNEAQERPIGKLCINILRKLILMRALVIACAL